MSSPPASTLLLGYCGGAVPAFFSSTSNSERNCCRVNTFRRLDLLRVFLDYYKECPQVREVQVVWSDQANNPPLDWGVPGKITFEVHKENSLNNRFRAIIPVPTDAVLSIDDDIVVPCDELQTLHETWQLNQR